MIAQGLYDPIFEHDSCGVGFVCNIKGEPSNTIVKQGVEVLHRLSHRGAVGSDPKTGDGAGVLIQTPHDFFKKVAKDIHIDLPDKGFYGSGLIFLPQDENERKFCKKTIEEVIKRQGQVYLGWRMVPIDNSGIGEGARNSQSIFEQIFIGRSRDIVDELAFERRLYCIRKEVESIIAKSI